jgi:hypothetical protein
MTDPAAPDDPAQLPGQPAVHYGHLAAIDTPRDGSQLDDDSEPPDARRGLDGSPTLRMQCIVRRQGTAEAERLLDSECEAQHGIIRRKARPEPGCLSSRACV